MTRLATRLTVLRLLQVALAVGAVFAALDWDAAAPAARPIARETLTLDLAAPVTAPLGPWHENATFTEHDAGIRVDVAPTWNVTVRHAVEGGDALDHAWSAEVRAVKVAGDGRAWWSTSETIPLEAEGPSAALRLDAAELVDRAEAMDEEADVPGRLDLALEVRHRGTVVVDGEARATERRVVLALVPAGDVVGLVVTEDAGEWSAAAPRGWPWRAIAAAAAALTLEVPARRLARDVPAWARARGVRVVEADGVRPPPEAPRVALADALAAARETGSVVLVDRARGVAVVQGAVALVAALDPGSGPVPGPLPGPAPAHAFPSPSRVPEIPRGLRPDAAPVLDEAPALAFEVLGILPPDPPTGSSRPRPPT